MDYTTRSNLIAQLNKEMNQQKSNTPKKFNGYFSHATGTYYLLTNRENITPSEVDDIQNFLFEKFKESTICAVDSVEKKAYALAIEAIEKLKEVE